MESEAPDDEAQMGQTVLQQALDLWINPEIERRKAAHQLPPNFLFDRAQVVFHPTGGQTVRLNDEVKAVMRLRLKRAVAAGEAIFENDVDDVESIDLVADDGDSAHLTILRFRSNLHIHFDFRYNAMRVRELLATAREFLDSATESLSAGRTRVFVDNLFSAIELMAKGELLLHAHPLVSKGKSHGTVSGPYNLWVKLKNAHPDYARLLNKLPKLRDGARYLNRPFTLDEQAGREMLDVAERMYAHVETRIPRRPPVPPSAAAQPTSGDAS